ncbi:hypothetical protein PAL_GLEAN10015411 [Pteropus alecto]|uniref:Uncharacterized protein n=1 Tax=Pteropus alecto TaxID=9402 RepID=L5KIC7_PTEAL|nr:hypothetical protein PAL_GLEAN10015411 [Pteropus alecto]
MMDVTAERPHTESEIGSDSAEEEAEHDCSSVSEQNRCEKQNSINIRTRRGSVIPRIRTQHGLQTDVCALDGHGLVLGQP